MDGEAAASVAGFVPKNRIHLEEGVCMSKSQADDSRNDYAHPVGTSNSYEGILGDDEDGIASAMEDFGL
jgi:hypothetical protein